MLFHLICTNSFKKVKLQIFDTVHLAALIFYCPIHIVTVSVLQHIMVQYHHLQGVVAIFILRTQSPFIHSFIHSSVICHTTGPKPLPKRFIHLMRSRASSFKWEYPLLSPRSSNNCLRLLPRLLVTSIRPFIFP
jgi:hypothetical protein